MNHMMIDLETLSLDPRAIVFQIGAVVFDLRGNILDARRFDLDILPQVMKGRRFDGETQKWWMTQNETAWTRDLACVNSAEHAIEQITALWNRRECSFVWANSPSFDCVIMKTLAADFDMKLPWDHRSEMDVRTIKQMNTIARLPAADPFETTHNAVQDCKDQVAKVVFYWNNIIGAEQQDIVTKS